MRIVLRDKELAPSSAIVLRSHAYHNDIDFVGSDLVTEILFDSQRKFFPNLQFFQQLRTQIIHKTMDDLGAEIRTNTDNGLAASSSAVCEAVDNKHGLSVLHQQQNNEWCDVILFAKGAMVGIKGHKMILASASPHLRDAFKSKGFVDSGANEYYVEQLDHETLQVIVDFIYSSTLRVAGDGIGDRLGSILIGADYLLMPDLVHICGQSLAHPAYLNVACLMLVFRPSPIIGTM